MRDARLFLCNGFDSAVLKHPISNEKVVSLSSRGSQPNVIVNFEQVAKTASGLSERLIDLLDIASFVYAADSGSYRGSSITRTTDDELEDWDRKFHLAIPVYDFEFWSQPKITGKLRELLRFLSNDDFTFEFTKSKLPSPIAEYLDFGPESWPFSSPDRVIMFSGGLDSLAGAVETIQGGKDIVLVSHRSSAKVDYRTNLLFEQLENKSGNRMIRVPVVVQRKGRPMEHNPRTRTLLFATLGLVVGETLQAGGIRFYENGIVSLNLPVADEVLRSRASRTTHPISIAILNDLFDEIVERRITIDNPFLFFSKRQVIEKLKAANATDLIPYSCSCAHVMYRTKNQQHCGTCSQCIDRRMAIIAAGCESFDPETDYAVDVFTGPRKDGYQKSMAVDYVRHALELKSLGDTGIAERFAVELLRAAKTSTNRAQALNSLIQMHSDHGESVYSAIERKIETSAERILLGTLPDSSLLAMVVSKKHLENSWIKFANHIGSMLAAAVPVACKTEKPANEPRLQEICEAILVGHDHDIVKEFPFMKWSLSATKPDFSSEKLALWIEIKYVRTKSDVKPIISSIAEDITKYGDNQRNVLFWVYDPNHCVIDEKEFSEDIIRHEMMITFAR
jgi:7-cyano-7-deazaguanine synthase in queuosine biosynthesis